MGFFNTRLGTNLGLLLLASGAELVSNGDLELHDGTEDDGTSDNFTDWTNVGVNDGSGDKLEATATVNGGSYAAKMTNTTSGPYMHQTITTIAGETYEFTFYTRGDATRQGRYGVYDVTNTTWLIADGTLTGVSGVTYTKITVSFVAGSTSTRLYIEASAGPGAVYFDDISVKQRFLS